MVEYVICVCMQLCIVENSCIWLDKVTYVCILLQKANYGSIIMNTDAYMTIENDCINSEMIENTWLIDFVTETKNFKLLVKRKKTDIKDSATIWLN